MKIKSRWPEFVADFGDSIGGIFVGYGLSDHYHLATLFGTALIFGCIYFKFYKNEDKKGNRGEDQKNDSSL